MSHDYEQDLARCDERTRKAAVALASNAEAEAKYYAAEAEAALSAADAHDRANGIHRLTLDDATVERAARALIVSIWKIPNAWEIASQRERDGLTAHARITLAASMEAIK